MNSVASTVSVIEEGRIRRWSLMLLLALQLPMLAEPLRKYVWQSNAALVAADICLVLVALFVLLQRPYLDALKVALWLSLMCAWQLITTAAGHQEPMLGAVGMRAVIVPAAALIVSIYFFRGTQLGTASSWMYKVATVWLVIIGGMGLLQLALGPESAINEIPGELGSDEHHGIGDYNVMGSGIEGLFRPTSVFLHTGKFGQIAFVLATYSVFFRYAHGVTGIGAWTRIAFELAILLMSGQRAGIIAYLAAVFALYLTSARFAPRLILLLTLGAAGVGLWHHAPKDGMDVSLGALLFYRAASGAADVSERLHNNLLTPLPAVFEHAGLTGVGAGAYSLGSLPYGGRPLYDVIEVGEAENAWLRIWAELGLPGLLLFVVAVGGLAGVAVKSINTRHLGNKESVRYRMFGYFGVFLVVALSAWSVTHDVLGSTTTMATALAYCGVVFARPRRPYQTSAWSGQSSR